MSDIDYQSPMYLQLREVIRNKIESGEYPPGTAIPTEKELAETYGLNRLTVRSAIETLANEGILKKIQGKGVFVMGEKMERTLDTLGGFTQVLKDRNMKSATKILAKGIRKASIKFGDIFRIDPNQNIYHIKSLNFSQMVPRIRLMKSIFHSVFYRIWKMSICRFLHWKKCLNFIMLR